MKFSYELNGAGWADGYIEINSNSAYFTASYLSNVLEDLLKSLFLLIPECVPYPQKLTTFEIHEEPGGTVWTLEKINNEQVSVKIVSYADIFTKKEELGIDIYETCSLSQLVNEVIKALDILLNKHGVEGYKKTWVNHEFPMRFFVSLKEYLQHEKRKQ